MLRSLDGDTVFFDIVSGVLVRDTLAYFLLITFLDYVMQKRQ